MIVWNGMDLIALGICAVLLILGGLLMLIGLISQKCNDRKKKRDREWWDKREEGEE